MNRYHHFDDELDLNIRNSAAILHEVEIDEPYQLEVNSQISTHSSNYSKLKIFFLRRTLLERYLFFLTIFLLIILFIITIIYLRYSKENFYNSICLTPSCIQVSYEYYSSINQTIDPCENFHEFVCGNWIKKNIIPKGHSSWSIINELTKKNIIILKNLLEQTSISLLLSNTEQQTIKYYQSCMNITESERLHIEPLEKFFQLNLNFTLNQWINLDKNQTWQQLFIYLIKIFSNQYEFTNIFPIKISPDEKNSTWYNIHINQPKLILDSRDYYINSTKNNRTNQNIREAYSKVGSDILQLLGFEKNDSIKRMDNIIQFETELAIVNLPMEILQKPLEKYHLMSLKQFQEQYKSIGFDIYLFLNDIFNVNISNPIKLNENDQIIVYSYELMLNISKILTNYLLTLNKSYIIIDHLLFSFVFDKILYLSPLFEKTLLPLKKELYGIDSLTERWEFCIKRTDEAFGYGLGALYSRAVFDETDRLKANELVKNIRISFEENLNNLQWIDEQSKIEAKKKLEKMNEKIGYPEFIKNQTKLNERYADYSIMENEYFNNAIQVQQREHRRRILKYRQKVDSIEWSITPRTVNAYYALQLNEIVFPAGILQSPLFHKDLPLAINYGAIGSVIGHEVTHGFDNEGREYDSNGNLRSWWTNISLNNFQEKTNCFIKQYSNFSIDGQYANGQRTLDENIADNGGVKISYFAYQKHKQRTLNTSNDLRLPSLNYNNDQLFFIAFAYTWCDIETSNSLHDDLISDPHSPASIRIFGTVQNSDEFSKAFSCRSNTMMNPSSKCQLW
ncbi:unnamed protein product [Rotaria sordida]|uniref:Endothelin-converting enzyme 1 n=1 Tax=Rotaria sordida TaxID=392033 RepID=A0A814RTF3_9BILA|nr:unnamed protein product [Rotaria sordida]